MQNRFPWLGFLTPSLKVIPNRQIWRLSRMSPEQLDQSVQPFSNCCKFNPWINLNCIGESGEAAQINVPADWSPGSLPFVSLDPVSWYIFSIIIEFEHFWKFAGKSKKAEAEAIKIFCGQEKEICQTNVDTCRHQIIPQKSSTWQSNYLRQQKIAIFVILLAGKGFPLFTLARGAVPSSRNRFLVDGGRGASRQSAILLPASHDTIGHYWTSGTAVQ